MADLREDITASFSNGIINVRMEERIVACGVLIATALIPIIMGPLRSVIHHQMQKKSVEETIGITLTSRYAALLPLYASCILFGSYIFAQRNVNDHETIVSDGYISLLRHAFIVIAGIPSMHSSLFSAVVNRLFSQLFPNEKYHIILSKEVDDKKIDVINHKFDRKDILSVAISSFVGVWYVWNRHWIASNILGLAFSIKCIELIQLNKISTGCILLGGFLIEDTFMVFGSDIMMTVAKSYAAPNKLLFPRDLLTNGLAANNFAMLGLGDIIIPGIFIALLLRIDISLHLNCRTYFYSSCVAYILGLCTSFGMSLYFNHAQPALLYLVPACVGMPLLVALVNRELGLVFKYEDSPPELVAHNNPLAARNLESSKQSIDSQKDQ